MICKKVCHQIGLSSDSVVTGSDLIGINEAKLTELATSSVIFAKLTPLQKADVVRALRKQNHIVGFLGDG